MHVLFAGMRGSGKSTACVSTTLALRKRYPGFTVGLHELDIWSDTHPCILGEKPWGQRNKRGHTHPGDELIEEYLAALEVFAADDSTIVLGDLPGRPNRAEHDILKEVVDGVVLVARNLRPDDQHQTYPQAIEFWERTLGRLGLPVIASVHSVFPGQQSPLNRIAIDGLNRRPIPEHPGINDLAAILAADLIPPVSTKEAHAREIESVVEKAYAKVTGASSPATT